MAPRHTSLLVKLMSALLLLPTLGCAQSRVDPFRFEAISSLDGMTEFMCHPGFVGPELLSARTRLKESRLRELQALTSPRIRKLIAESDIRLENFSAERI